MMNDVDDDDADSSVCNATTTSSSVTGNVFLNC